MAAAQALFFAMVLAFSSAGAAFGQQLERTANLGLHLVQDGATVALTEAEQRDGYRVYEATLRPATFEILAPVSTWSADRTDAPMRVALSTAPDFLDLLAIGRTAFETRYFDASFVRAMAWDPEAPGELLTAERRIWDERPDLDYGYNSLGAHRYSDTSADEHRFVVASIQSRQDFTELMVSGSTLLVVTYIDRRLGDPPEAASSLFQGTMEDVIAAGEVDVIRLRFE
jgi:hypothetical protein